MERGRCEDLRMVSRLEKIRFDRASETGGTGDGGIEFDLVGNQVFDPDPDKEHILDGSNGRDLFLARYDLDGNFLSSGQFGSLTKFSVGDIDFGTATTDDVTIAISSSDTSESTVDKMSLTFTPANRNRPQTVTVRCPKAAQRRQGRIEIDTLDDSPTCSDRFARRGDDQGDAGRAFHESAFCPHAAMVAKVPPVV